MLTRLFVSPQTMKEKIGIKDELHLKTLTDILKIRLIGLRDIPEPVTSFQCATNCKACRSASEAAYKKRKLPALLNPHHVGYSEGWLSKYGLKLCDCCCGVRRPNAT